MGGEPAAGSVFTEVLGQRYGPFKECRSGGCWFGFKPLSADLNPFPQVLGEDFLSCVADARLDGPADFLESFQRSGSSFLGGLHGEFALAIYDQRSTRLFLARDRIGVKPLYYFANSHLLVFGSDIRDVLGHPGVAQDYDDHAVAHYLTSVAEPPWDSTFFSKVKKLAPGHWLTYSAGKIIVQGYWTPCVQPLPFRSRDVRDYSSYLSSLLQDSVRRRLSPHLPTGAHLSGGLDSSAIAVLAARELRKQGSSLTAFSWSPPLVGPLTPNDERRRVRQICQQEELACHYLQRFSHDSRSFLMRDPAREPIEMAFLEEPLQRLASQSGIKVVLSGWGGDEFASFNGRGVLPEAFLRLRWAYVWSELKLLARRRGASWIRTFLSKVVSVLLPAPLYDLRFPVDSPVNYLHPRYAKLAKPPDRCRELPGGRRNMQALWRMGHLARRMESWAASGFSTDIDYRYPLLDVGIVEFCYSVPEWLHQFRGYTRFLFRQAVESLLPADMVWGFPKEEQSAWTMTIAPRLDPDPGALLRGLRQKAENQDSTYVDLRSLLADWDIQERRGPLRSRAIQAAHLS